MHASASERGTVVHHEVTLGLADHPTRHQRGQRPVHVLAGRRDERSQCPLRELKADPDPVGQRLAELVGEVQQGSRRPRADVVEGHPGEGVRRLHRHARDVLEEPLHRGRMPAQELHQPLAWKQQAAARHHRGDVDLTPSTRMEEAHLTRDVDGRVEPEDDVAALAAQPV